MLFLLTYTVQGQRASRRYIAKYTALADSIWRHRGIPPSVTLAIALVETGAGTSALCVKFNNHFGFRGTNTNSIKKLGKPSSYKEYHSARDSYHHFTKIIMKKRFYRSLKGNPNSALWVHALKKSGYASNPNWETHVNSLITRFNLYSLDERRANKPQPHIPDFIKYRTVHRPLWE